MAMFTYALGNQSTASSVSGPSTYESSRSEPWLCIACLRDDCNLQTHKAYNERLQHRQHGRRARLPERKLDVARLMSTPFAYSYAFNPLAVAIHHVYSQLSLDYQPKILADSVNLSHALHKFIAYGISRNVPFTDPSGACDVAAQWLVAASLDELACTSTLLLWTVIENNSTGQPELENFGVKLATLFLEMLRKRVENSGGMVSAGTVFAASNHLATYSMFFDQTNEEREVMMNGVVALVNHLGGFEALHSAHNGLLQSLLWSDVLHSWNTGTRPRFRLATPPLIPSTLVPERRIASVIPLTYLRCCGPDLIDSARHLRLFLLFRHSTEIRNLTAVEYRWMVQLERFVHFQLLEQQARYHLTNTISECIILAMGIVRMTVLCLWEQHAQVRRTHVQRLNRALNEISYETWVRSDALYPLIWVCWIVLGQTESCYDQDMVLQRITSALKATIGEDAQEWPEDWATGFPFKFLPLLWHSDCDASVPRVAQLIKDFVLKSEV